MLQGRARKRCSRTPCTWCSSYRARIWPGRSM